MKTLIFLFLLLYAGTIQAQYYYDDLLGARELSDKMKTCMDHHVKTITAAGYDPRGIQTTDYNESQEIDAANRILKIATRNGQQITRQFYRFDDRFRLLSITDSSTDIKSVTTYHYDNSGHIISIKTETEDTLQGLSETEDHEWQYTDTGKPEKMWRIINSTDSTEYRFTTGPAGNVIDEQLYRRGARLDPVYYYYDSLNRLTDIVRYNKQVKRLIPDFMFEYDAANRVIQKIATLSVLHPNYLIWRYAYNEQGLKTKEALFNKQKELTGSIKYTFTYAP